jgi:phosphoglycolate phosphatase
MTQFRARPCRLFLFDLDGTLIDSRADITASLNLMLRRMRFPELLESRAADFVGDGVQTLIERALREVTGIDADPSLVRTGIAVFREEYENHLLDRTCLFPHAMEALDRLAWAQFAVVSNKPEVYSRQILEALGVAARFTAILGGDSARKRKPDPESLYRAMEFCGVPASLTAMVGDSPVDIEAGKAAGVTACGVLGGFRSRADLERAGCDLIIENLLQLADYFRSPRQQEEKSAEDFTDQNPYKNQ